MNGEKNELVVASTDPELPDVLDKTNPADISAPADLALNLIFEAGSAMRTQEERIAHAVFELRQVIQLHQANLEKAETRANIADSALHEARIELNTLIAKLCKARDTLVALKEDVVARERDLAAMNERAEAAKRQALDMSAVLSMLIEEIRAKLPTAFGAGK
jgi:chromosome segregation ATPase